MSALKPVWPFAATFAASAVLLIAIALWAPRGTPIDDPPLSGDDAASPASAVVDSLPAPNTMPSIRRPDDDKADRSAPAVAPDALRPAPAARAAEVDSPPPPRTSSIGDPPPRSRAAAICFEGAVAVPQGKVDELVFARLGEVGLQPAALCSDGVFVRRVFLDVIGTLPTADEARAFLADRDPGKRRAIVDRLLARREFADYWAMKWCDLLRVKAEFPINLWPNAAQAYHRWIRASIKENLPYDRFVRELLTASGSNFRVPQVNFYRALQSREPPAIAQAVALNFMGTRAEKWPQPRLAGMAVFFSKIGYKGTAEWKEEIVMFDPDKKPREGMPGRAVFPDGNTTTLDPERDPREVFADWLIRPENPWFARQIVNRVWCWLVGRGVVHEPDDIRSDNPPQNRELLDWLAGELVRSRYDLKHIYRLILHSATYQLAPVPRGDPLQSARHFGHYPLRRLEAEVLIDAICQITGTTESYSSPIPEPFTFLPEHLRSIALPDGSITSSFLEMFGRPPRDTGLESERNNRTTAAQRLHLLNSSHIRRKFEQGAGARQLLQSGLPADKATEALYLTILSRPPTPEELSAASSFARRGQSGLMDLAWALINSTEFLFRH